MTYGDADTVMELAHALGHHAEREDETTGVYFGGSYTPVTLCTVRVFSDGPEFIHYDAAMAYLQALGVRDE